jgi:hypothetical protein
LGEQREMAIITKPKKEIDMIDMLVNSGKE